jgi:hypothetical protein
MSIKGSVDIDDMHGVLTIHKNPSVDKDNFITIKNAEKALITMNSPGSDATISFKSVHDSSYLKCYTLKLVLT